jgi:phosphate starvation-inducible protein PhoH
MTENRPKKSLKMTIDGLITIDPLTENQKSFMRAYKDGTEILFQHGSAGTGKTFLAIYKALEEVMDKGIHQYHKLIIVRSAVPTRDTGFLPGSLEEKCSIYTLPYKQICNTLFNRPDAWDRLLEQHFVEFISTSYVRGVTFDNAIVVVDEVQSLNFHEISSIFTRIGKHSKIIFCGDSRQDDLKKSSRDCTGIHNFMKVLQEIPEAVRIEYTPDDIVRSDIVKKWIVACDKLGLDL